MMNHDHTPAADTGGRRQGAEPRANSPDTSTMTPDQATALLAQAERARAGVPASIPSAIVTLGMLCTTGTFGTLALSFATQVPQIARVDTTLTVIVLILCWIVTAITLPMLFRAPWRKGLAARWIAYMVVWALLWALAIVLPVPYGLWTSVLFIPLYAIACGIEAMHARGREEA